MSTLLEKKAAYTEELLLSAACKLVETHDVSELTFKVVADEANISQRTMFRYFRTREAFLDALTQRLYSKLALPSVPERIEDLPEYVETLYTKLDAHPRKVVALLSSDLLPRVLDSTARERLKAITALLRETYPLACSEDITKTAANLRYIMSASSWQYYRMAFHFDLPMSIACAQLIVKQSLRYLESISQQE